MCVFLVCMYVYNNNLTLNVMGHLAELHLLTDDICYVVFSKYMEISSMVAFDNWSILLILIHNPQWRGGDSTVNAH